MYSYGSPHTAAQKQDDQHERTFSSCVRIQDVVLKTCLGRWTIGRSGERGSGISVLPARYDDDDDRRNIFVSYLFFYLFFLYISFGTFFGQGIAPASQRGVKQCNQNMESDILQQHNLALSPWPSKAFKSHKVSFLLRCDTKSYEWTPNETRAHSWRFASLACKPLSGLRTSSPRP